MGTLDKYSLWLSVNLPVDRKMSPSEAVDLMQRFFPELIKVSGEILIAEILGLTNFEMRHVWLKDSAGNIIDPINYQNQIKILRYKELGVVIKAIPAKCYLCDKPRSQNSNFCSDSCEEKFFSHMNSSFLKKSL